MEIKIEKRSYFRDQNIFKQIFCQLLCSGDSPKLLSVCSEPIWAWWATVDDCSGDTASWEPCCWFDWARGLLLHFKISIRIEAPHITTPNPVSVASRIARTACMWTCHLKCMKIHDIRNILNMKKTYYLTIFYITH